MRLRWVGLAVVVGVLVLTATCVGAIIAIGLTQSDYSGGDHVAVVRVHGTIVTRDSQGLFSTGNAGAHSIIDQLQRARESDSAKAILLDVNSPGGGVVASRQIYNEVVRVQEAGKPIIAYFGDTAASGGYYVAAAADAIIANPATLTGSIGAIASVPNLQELYEKLGIDMQLVTSGEFKDMLQPSRPMTDEEREILQRVVDESYQDFVQAVADGRGMDVERVRELADGRIYTGQQAADNGLVDELGDYEFAVDYVGEQAGLGDDPTLRDYGPDLGFWDVFTSVASEGFDLPSLFDLDFDPRNMHVELQYQAQ